MNHFSTLGRLQLQPTTNGTLLTRESIEAQSYSLERAVNGSAPFDILQKNIPGEAGTTRFTDTNILTGTALYRVGIE
jgi:hypothetical protein